MNIAFVTRGIWFAKAMSNINVNEILTNFRIPG